MAKPAEAGFVSLEEASQRQREGFSLSAGHFQPALTSAPTSLHVILEDHFNPH